MIRVPFVARTYAVKPHWCEKKLDLHRYKYLYTRIICLNAWSVQCVSRSASLLSTQSVVTPGAWHVKLVCGSIVYAIAPYVAPP